MDTSRRKMLEHFFPKLCDSNYEITSPPATEYNCIAWAAGESAAWWEPDPAFIYYWPPGVPREYTLESFVRAYSSLGFQPIDDDSFQSGVEKVAIFVKEGRPQHATRQLNDGTWTSKCGQLEDISHTLYALEGDEYGMVEVILARSQQAD